MLRQVKVLLFAFIMLLSAACGSTLDIDALAELANPQAAGPTPTATVTTLPSLRTLQPADMTATAEANFIQPAAVYTATPDPNAIELDAVAAEPEVAPPADTSDAPSDVSAEEVAAEPTLIPPTPAPLPTTAPPAAPPEISLRTPLAGSQFIAGTGIDVSGSAAGITPGQLIRVALVNPQGGQIADVTLIAKDGEWRVILPAPAEITGPLSVEVKVAAADGLVLAETSASIEAIGNITVSEIPENDYFMAIDRLSSQAVAGKGIFLNGRSGSPLDVYDVTIEIFYQDCATSAGPISFQMFGSGGWNGYLIVPGNTQGSTICVRAYTGTPGTDSYRQAEKKFVVVDGFSAESRSIQIATPRPGSYYTAPFPITGIAINPPLGYVLVQLVATDGAVLWEETVIPDGYGNWSATADLTVLATTPVRIAAIFDNADGTFLTDEHTINVQSFAQDN